MIDFIELDLLQSAFSGSNAEGMSARRIKVPVTTLMAALTDENRPVDFIKCDVEGAERSALTARDRVLALGQRLMSQDHRRSFFERVPENAQILVLSRSFGAG